MIDIIIPLYNSKKTLFKTLLSINIQTIKDKVIVYLIDDDSDEDYDDIVDLFKGKLKIKLSKLDSNSGPGYARQYGLEHSKSKYVMFVDSDDVLHNMFSLERILDVIEKGNYDIVTSYMTEIIPDRVYEYEGSIDTLHSKIYKREFIEKNNIFFPNLYNSEDLAFNNLFMTSNPKIGHCESFVYSYVRRENSLSTKNDYYKNVHIKKYMESLIWVIDTAKKQKKDKEEIAKVIVLSTSYLYYYFCNNMDDKSIKYVYKIMDYYDDYEKCLSKEVKTGLIEFWVQGITNIQLEMSYYDFLEILKNRNLAKAER